MDVKLGEYAENESSKKGISETIHKAVTGYLSGEYKTPTLAAEAYGGLSTITFTSSNKQDL